MKSKNNNFLFFLIIVIGFLLRFYHLGVQSLWFDEIATIFRIESSLSEMLRNLVLSSPFPPLYYIVMNIWVTFFGSNEFSMRFPSLIFSTLSLIFIFKFSKKLFNENVGLISALLLSVSVYSINYAQEAKMYSMFWFMGMLSFFFFYKFLLGHKKIHLLLYIIFTVLSLYTMYIGFLFIVIQNIIYFIFFGRRKLKNWLLGQVSIVILYIPWIFEYIYVIMHKQDYVAIHKPITRIYKTENLTEAFNLFTGIFSGRKIFLEPWLYLFLIIFALFGIILEIKKYHRLSLRYSLIGLWIIVPVIIYCLIDVLGRPILQIRYIGFIYIPLIIFFSAGLSFYAPRIKTLILILLVLFTFSAHLYPYYRENLKIHGEDYRSMSKELQKRVKDDDLVVSDFRPKIASYYYKDHMISWSEEMEKYTENIKSNGSIFFLWRGKRPEEKNLQGYEVVDEYLAGGVGFLKLKKCLKAADDF